MKTTYNVYNVHNVHNVHIAQCTMYKNVDNAYNVRLKIRSTNLQIRPELTGTAPWLRRDSGSRSYGRHVERLYVLRLFGLFNKTVHKSNIDYHLKLSTKPDT